MHLIAIHGLAANELTFPLFIPLDGFDLLGNVFGIHIVHNGTEQGNVIGGGYTILRRTGTPDRTPLCTVAAGSKAAGS